MKDPAFLFYSNDFYEGTRTMFPEERACYIDLMIYQHQNGFIPNDIDRIKMYCTGCTDESIRNVLDKKFKQSRKGWYNEVLSEVMKARSDFSRRQSVNGIIGNFWKKARRILNDKDYNRLKRLLKTTDNDLLFNEISGKTIDIAMLNAMRTHLENGNGIVIENENVIENIKIDKGGVGEKERDEKNIFEIFRKKYPGTKRGLDTEFGNFTKRHTDHSSAVHLLLPALDNLIQWRTKKKEAGQFVPEYANLSTWINQRRWEAELEAITKQEDHSSNNKNKFY